MGARWCPRGEGPRTLKRSISRWGFWLATHCVGSPGRVLSKRVVRSRRPCISSSTGDEEGMTEMRNRAQWTRRQFGKAALAMGAAAAIPRWLEGEQTSGVAASVTGVNSLRALCGGTRADVRDGRHSRSAGCGWGGSRCDNGSLYAANPGAGEVFWLLKTR